MAAFALAAAAAAAAYLLGRFSASSDRRPPPPPTSSKQAEGGATAAVSREVQTSSSTIATSPVQQQQKGFKRPIQLFSIATPNGQKVAIALEEMGIPYEPHLVNITKGEQRHPDFLKISPNNKIPAITDPDGPGGKPISIFESGAILVYLADKAGKFLPKDARKRSDTMQWLFWQVGGVGPCFGQFGVYFKYARGSVLDTYPREKATLEVQRLLGVLDRRLSDGRDYIVGEYTIADMATYPWLVALDEPYGATQELRLTSYVYVMRWVERMRSRPAVVRGMGVTPFPVISTNGRT
eukprot:jgi/Chlat1/1384/Chrsp12S02050